MPAHFKWKVNARKKHKPAKKPINQPPWDNSVTDLTEYQLTPEEVLRRHIVHKSKNTEIAKLELLEKQHMNTKNKTDFEINPLESFEDKKTYNSDPSITFKSRLSVKESMDNGEINKDYCNYETKHIWINEKSELVNDMKNDLKIGYIQKNPQFDCYDMQELLLNFQRKLNIEESEDFKIDETNNCISNITSLFIKSLDKLNQKYIKICEELKAETRVRYYLEKEVGKLKLLLNEVIENVTSLQNEMKNNSPNVITLDQQCQTDHSLEIPSKAPSVINSTNREILTNNKSVQFPTNTLPMASFSELSGNMGVNGNYYSCINQSCYASLPQQWTKAIMLKPPIQLDLNIFNS